MSSSQAPSALYRPPGAPSTGVPVPVLPSLVCPIGLRGARAVSAALHPLSRRAALPRHGPQPLQRRGAPDLTEIPIGTQGIAFDRLELDAWVEQYKRRNGRPGPDGKDCDMGRTKNARPRQSRRRSGTSTSGTEAAAFAKALANATSRKRRSTSQGDWKRPGKPRCTVYDRSEPSGKPPRSTCSRTSTCDRSATLPCTCRQLDRFIGDLPSRRPHGHAACLHRRARRARAQGKTINLALATGASHPERGCIRVARRARPHLARSGAEDQAAEGEDARRLTRCRGTSRCGCFSSCRRTWRGWRCSRSTPAVVTRKCAGCGGSGKWRYRSSRPRVFLIPKRSGQERRGKPGGAEPGGAVGD